MAVFFKDRVKESSTDTGTGNFDLAGAATGFQTFNTAFGTGSANKFYYCIENGSEWEVGIGYMTDSDTLVRETILASSTGSEISFSAGTKTVFCTIPAVGVGYREIPQNSQSGAYTCVLADNGQHIFHPSADTTARTWTIPANSSVAYPIGAALTFVNQNGAGVITIAITTDTMRLAGAGTTGSRTLAANGIATAVKITSTEWLISGTGLS